MSSNRDVEIVTESKRASRIARSAPVCVGATGPFAAQLLNCLCREVLFTDLPVPMELHWAPYAPSLTLETDEEQQVDVLEDTRDWKVLRRAAYMKQVLARVATQCTNTKSVRRVVLFYPFEQPFESEIIFTTDPKNCDVVVETSGTAATSATLRCNGKMPVHNINLRLALASTMSGIPSAEGAQFGEFVRTSLRSALQAASKAHREMMTTVRGNYGPIVPYILPPDPTVEESTYIPQFMREEWQPRPAEWRPHPSDWVPHEPDWEPRHQDWQPEAAPWKPTAAQWKPQPAEWRPKQPDWHPQPNLYHPRDRKSVV